MKSCMFVNVSKLTTFVAFVLLLLCTESTKCTQTEKATSDEQPPLVFPEDDTKYKIIPNNDKILRTLTHVNSANDTEIYDMLHTPLAEGTLRNGDAPEDKSGESLDSDESLKVIKLETSPKFQSGLLQEENAYVMKDAFHTQPFHRHTGIWAIITLSIILVMSGLVYMGLFLWRKILVVKYGRRQILINEEDPASDFKHSEL